MPTFSKHSARKICLAGALFLLAGGPALAFPEAQFQSAFQQFMSAPGSGSEEAAAESFSALLKQEPANPLLMAYTGAATTKLATTTIFPWKKMAYAEEGLAMLDKALQLAADSKLQRGSTPLALEVRFVAANTFLAVPGFMNRATRGGKLLNEVLEHPQFGQADLSFRGAVWLRAAGLALEQKRGDDARRFLQDLIQHGAPQAEIAKGMLKGVA